MNTITVQDQAAGLPVQPQRQQDEWSETYLARAARAMGIRRPWRHDLEALRGHLPASASGNDDGRPCYASEPLPGWAVLGRGAQIRVCPQCLLESRYIRARWRIPFLTVCTVHNVALKEGLVEPAITSNYKRADRRVAADATADDVNAGATCPTPIGLGYAKAMWKPFEDAVRSNATDAVIADCLAWALLAERLLDAVVTAIRGPDYPSKDSVRHEHRGAWLNKQQLGLAPNRTGIQALILSLNNGCHRRAVLNSLTRLIFDEHRRRTVMSRLPLADLKDRLLAVFAVDKIKACGALPRSMHPPGCKSLEAVEAILGCQASLLQYMVREQHFDGVIQIQFGRKRYVFVPDAEVERIRRFLANCMTFSELLEALAIDKQGYWALHDAGLLCPVELGSWRRYPRQEVSALLNRLDTVSRPLSTLSEQYQPLLGAWLHMRRRPRDFIGKILHDILDGSVPVYKHLQRSGLAAYFVDYQAPMRLRHSTELHHATTARERTTTGQLLLWESA